MPVYAASDLHGNLPAVPRDAELLLLAGDICPDFRAFKGQPGPVDTCGTRQRDWLITDFHRWHDEQVPPGCKIIMIWGNHDFVGEKAHLVGDFLRTCSVKLLQDSGTFVQRGALRGVGLQVYGTPWVPGLPYWAFYGREEALQLRSDAIPPGMDVLMTHGPPYGAGDFIPTSEKQRNKYGNFGGQHVGDGTLNGAISSTQPKVVICGHIHEDRGVHEVAGVPVHNVAAVNENYVLHEHPWTRLYELEV